MYKLRKTTRNIGYNMMGDIIQFPNAYQGNNQYAMQKRQELAWLKERLDNIKQKLAMANVAGTRDDIYDLELQARNLLRRRRFLLGGGDPADKSFQDDNIYPDELVMLDDMRELKLEEYEECEGDENTNPEKAKIGREYEEIDDVKNSMKKAWLADEEFSDADIDKYYKLLAKYIVPPGFNNGNSEGLTTEEFIAKYGKDLPD